MIAYMMTAGDVDVTILPREFKIRTTQLRAYSDGRIDRWMKSGRWKEIKNTMNHAQGYNVILIDKKQYMRGRVMGTAFLGIDPENKNMVVFHLDGNRMNTDLGNLSTLSHSQANRAAAERQHDKKKEAQLNERLDAVGSAVGSKLGKDVGWRLGSAVGSNVQTI
jgi:hypothetical protein